MADPWLESVRQLHEAGVPLLAIGSWALHLHGCLPEDYLLPDADLVLAPDEAGVQRAGTMLLAQGWTLWRWQEPVYTVPPLQELLPAFYLRALRGEARLDLTVAGLQPDYQEMQTRSCMRHGVPLACVEHILQLKRSRNSERDRVLLARLGDSPFLAP